MAVLTFTFGWNVFTMYRNKILPWQFSHLLLAGMYLPCIGIRYYHGSSHIYFWLECIYVVIYWDMLDVQIYWNELDVAIYWNELNYTNSMILQHAGRCYILD